MSKNSGNAACSGPAASPPYGPRCRAHVATTHGSRRATAQRGKVLNFDTAWQITHDWTILNRYVYGVKLGGGRAVSGTRSAADLQRLSSSNGATEQMLKRASCHGSNDFKVGIGYYRLRLNGCLAQSAEYASIFVAASVSFLGAVVPVAAPLKVVAVVSEFLFNVAAIELAICNRNNRGVQIYYTMATGVVPVFCRQQ